MEYLILNSYIWIDLSSSSGEFIVQDLSFDISKICIDHISL